MGIPTGAIRKTTDVAMSHITCTLSMKALKAISQEDIWKEPIIFQSHIVEA
jgi:hypothetical protein